MAKITSFTPSKNSSGKWVLNVPAAVSPNGKRQRLTFATRKAAELEAERLKAMAGQWGRESTRLPADVAADAAKAVTLLEGHDVSLYAVAQDWLTRKQAAEASCTLRELFDRYIERKVAEGISEPYRRDIEKFFAPLLNLYAKRNLTMLTHRQIDEVLQTAFNTTRQRANAYRNIRPAFADALLDGLLVENPFDRIKPPKHRSRAPEALTCKEARAVIDACCNHKENSDLCRDYQLDCTDSAPAFALMVFAGIRPAEVGRLQWEKVHLDEGVVIVDGETSKVRSHRIVQIEDNLAAWLETVPPAERTGGVTPANWDKKYQAVRKVSKIGTRQQDILRHTYASAHLAAFADFNALQANMGHGTREMILNHYKALMRKPDAVKFWSIRPDGNAPQIKATA